MIAIAVVIIVLASLAATPWRRLSSHARAWTIVAAVNTAIFFAMPTTTATSPWRPVVANAIAIGAAVSALLLVGGLFVRRQRESSIGVGSLVLSWLPFAFYAFFRLIGPIY